MERMPIREIIDMVISDVADPDERLEKMFDWEHERNIEVIKWILGASAAIFVAVLAAFFKGDVKAPAWQLPAGLISSLLSGTYGLYRLRQMRKSYRNYVGALRLLSEFKRIETFLKRYRRRR
jgi:hypothetical protein